MIEVFLIIRRALRTFTARAGDVRHRLSSFSREASLVCSLALVTGMSPLCQMEQNENATGVAALEPLIQSGNFPGFLAVAKKTPLYKASKNDLLLRLDTGVAEMFAGDPRAAGKKLSSVGDIAESHYTKSVSRQIAAVLTNDLALPYSGEDYEVAFSGSAAALAFAAAGDMEGALVEVRRSEHRLAVMSDAYEGEAAKYRDDAFAHYLAGMLYEAAGRTDDARISYALADSVYGTRFFPVTPPGLAEALARFPSIAAPVVEAVTDSVSAPTKRSSAASLVLKPITLLTSVVSIIPGIPGSGASKTAVADSAAPRTVLLCAFTGRGPVKDETVIRAGFTDNGVEHMVKLAMPVLRKRTGSIRTVRVSCGGAAATLDMAADYSHIAENAFNDRRPLLYARTLARVSARYLILKAAKEKTVEKLKKSYEEAKEKHGEDSGEAAGAWLKMKTASLGLDMLANELLEHADTRGSVMIPERIHCRLVTIPRDVTTITLEFLDSAGGVVETQKRDLAAFDTLPLGSPAVALFAALR